jgi:bisanhydrobacterioruberin hydratase
VERKDSMNGTIGLYLIFGFGVLWLVLPLTRDIVMGLTPWALLLAYFIVIYPEVKQKNWSIISWLFIVSLLTFALEVAGVSTARIFGAYNYGDNLGAKVLGVPVIIGLNWGIVIWGCAEIAMKFKMPLFSAAISAALLAVILDFLIEPAASFLDFWSWSGGIIPLQNYIAWFVIAFIFSFFYLIQKDGTRSNLPVHFYATQILFFGMINIMRL